MTERYRPQCKDGQPRPAWNPENPTTDLERCWNALPQLGKRYFEADWRLRDPNLTIQERSDRSLELFNLFNEVCKTPDVLHSVINFITKRDGR